MSGEQASTRPFSDEGYGVVRKIVKQGGKILFFQQAFFPILEVIVVCREINKDAALSEIDLVLMKLVRAGMTQLDDLASLCGLSSTRVKVVMSDLAGRGYIKHGLLAELTDLGEIAIDSGFDVLETKRAFLLCGWTGRLLPKPVYQVEAFTVGEIKPWGRIPIIETEAIATKKLPTRDLIQLPTMMNRDHYNIAYQIREVMAFEQTTPKFVKTTAIVFKDRNGTLSSEMVFPSKAWENMPRVDWIPPNAILEILKDEPWGWRDTKEASPRQMLEELKQSFVSLGLEIKNQDLEKPYASPILSLVLKNKRDLTPLKTNAGSQMLVSLIGTRKFPPIPLDRYPVLRNGVVAKWDTVGLGGRPLVLWAADNELEALVNGFRSVDESMYDYYDIPYEERKQLMLPQHVESRIKKLDLSFEEVKSIIGLLGKEKHKKAVGLDEI